VKRKEPVVAPIRHSFSRLEHCSDLMGNGRVGLRNGTAAGQAEVRHRPSLLDEFTGSPVIYRLQRPGGSDCLRGKSNKNFFVNK
jgi:hypothetical protein